jgi:predicted NACHT family NTPase
MTPPDPLNLSAHGISLLGSIFKSVWVGVKSPPQWILEQYQTSDPFGTEAKKYVNHIFEAYNSMRIIGMSEPTPLSDIYINVNIKDRTDLGQFLDENFWTQRSGATGQHDFSARMKPAESVISEEQRVLILGRPGAGKTTFLKYLAISALNKSKKINAVPIFISLKEWSQEKNVNLETMLLRQFDVCDLKNKKEFVKRLLKKGKCLILLDGFDEIDPEFRAASIIQIESFVKDWSQNKFVLSCRTAANSYVFSRFIEIEVADFNENQIQIFIKKWFQKPPQASEKCVKDLYSEEHKGILDLASNPLLLTLICISYEESLSFPDNRVQLYKTALDALLNKWDASRAIVRFNSYKKLTASKKELLLSQIAVQKIQDESNAFKISEVERVIDNFMGELTDTDGYEGAKSVIEAIESQHGIIQKISDDEFAFSHLTFQEYYIARYILDRSSEEFLSSVLHKYVGEPSWNEILLILCGLQTEASQFLYQYKIALDAKKTSLVDKLLEFSSKAIKNSEKYHPSLNVLLCLSQILAAAKESSEYFGEINSLSSMANLTVGAVLSAYEVDASVENASITVTQLGTKEGREFILKSGQKLIEYNGSLDELYQFLVGTYILATCLHKEAIIRKSYKMEILNSLLKESCPKPPQINENPFDL